MRLVNLQVDDAFILGQDKEVRPSFDKGVLVKKIPLGMRIFSELPTSVYLDLPEGFPLEESFWETQALVPRHLLPGNRPVWGLSPVEAYEPSTVLFLTGFYTPDGSALLEQPTLRLTCPVAELDYAILAGGFKPLASGEMGVNFAIRLPEDCQYQLSSGVFDVATGTPVAPDEINPFAVTLEKLFHFSFFNDKGNFPRPLKV